MKANRHLIILSLFFLSCKKISIEIPVCIQNKIEFFKSLPKGNPPQRIIQYTYNGKKVFYIPPQCCDQYSDLFDDNCNLLGHPDGGFTGRGDGTMLNFFTEAKDAIELWKDDR